MVKKIIVAMAETVAKETGVAVPYHVGTMIELPRAALRAGDIANSAEFFSFGTNDLTQTTLGVSRDDAASFLGVLYGQGPAAQPIPFVTLDAEGVGELVKIAAERGRETRPDIKLGVCGEHGGDPASIAFCESVAPRLRLLLALPHPDRATGGGAGGARTQGGVDGVTPDSCSRARRPRPLRDAQPGTHGQTGLGEAGYTRPLYPGSPSPVLARRPARNHRQTGLGEAEYTRPPVPRLAEPGPGETPAGTHGQTGLGEAGYTRPPVPGLAEPGPRRDAQPEITDRPASARPGTPAPL